jgi:hypothetical protein
MKKSSCSGLFIGWILVFGLMLSSASNVAASECIKCHTDKNKLQSITKNLPQKEKSTETAGQG